MRRRVNFGLLTCGLLLLAGACRDRDCPPCPDDLTINGLFWGSYAILEIHSGTDTTRSLGQPVSVKFRDKAFAITLTPGVAESLRVVCDMFGDYTLGEFITLNCWSVDSTDSCADPGLYPCGAFALDQTTDTLRLTRDVTADTVRFIKKLTLLQVRL